MINVDVKLNKNTFDKIRKSPDRIIYSIASETLQRGASNQGNMPKKTGRMRQESLRFGVKGSNSNYKIGSPTEYAKYVWVMNNTTTKWTTPGTESQWYINLLKKQGKFIITRAIKEQLK